MTDFWCDYDGNEKRLKQLDPYQVTWLNSGWVPQPRDRMRLCVDTKQQIKGQHILLVQC
jgi:hypothetical protein